MCFITAGPITKLCAWGEEILVCGRPGDRGDCTETPAALVPRHNVHKAGERERPGTPVILILVVVYYCST